MTRSLTFIATLLAAATSTTASTIASHNLTTQSWFTLIPSTSFIDSGSPINQTGLYLQTVSTEIDDGGNPVVTFGDGSADGQTASAFYIDASDGNKLKGNQDYWGLQTVYSWYADWSGSVWSATGTPDTVNYTYPAFEVDSEGWIWPAGEQGKGLCWGWCPDEDGVGDDKYFLPGTVVLAREDQNITKEGCVVFKGLKAVPTSAPSSD